ncbi:C40 family peptidase [Streptomyces zagrosensis]|uniref:Cell wall-associated NlpC family hydrolase n=1 Tax=Streptomyces zagrosensis TaxID=1042984 RepID=A0A7W9Q721_9ACTN|nr:NlpC/P60 family protein [Streptomyces zagrosensis]MBB5934750.1 cell wall-associated NlpC family hydrolase [Streptomyces zagrosensis]
MASHRRLNMPSGRRTAIGLTMAALASLTLLAQTAPPAHAAPTEPRPSIEAVKERVDTLYQEAGSATQAYNGAKEHTDKQRVRVEGLLGDVAERTRKVNEARRKLGAFATAQYRTGGISTTATLLLASDSQSFFDQSHLLARMTGRQQQALKTYQAQQSAATKERAKASRNLGSLTTAQNDLKTKKKAVQTKLTEARRLLSELTAEEQARLLELERKKKIEAERKAHELARQQADAARKERAERAERAERERRRRENADNSGSDDQSSNGSGAKTGGTDSESGELPGNGSGDITGPADPSYIAKAQQAIDFARAQLGKPYVWGATGPTSYDCSGLTQGAWRAAGVLLPRTTWDQVKIGKRVATSDLTPGDLVFFYRDSSHVGLYLGSGMMIHAPKPGASVRIESIFSMPIYGSIRPA